MPWSGIGLFFDDNPSQTDKRQWVPGKNTPLFSEYFQKSGDNFSWNVLRNSDIQELYLSTGYLTIYLYLSTGHVIVAK